MDKLYDIAKDIMKEVYADCDLVPTIGGRFQRHPHGLFGNMWRIKDPDSVRIGNCFMKGRLKEGDLWLCISHSGDCFQDYMFVEEYGNGYKGRPEWTFGSYGIGDSESVELKEGECEKLKSGGFVERECQY